MYKVIRCSKNPKRTFEIFKGDKEQAYTVLSDEIQHSIGHLESGIDNGVSSISLLKENGDVVLSLNIK